MKLWMQGEWQQLRLLARGIPASSSSLGGYSDGAGMAACRCTKSRERQACLMRWVNGAQDNGEVKSVDVTHLVSEGAERQGGVSV